MISLSAKKKEDAAANAAAIERFKQDLGCLERLAEWTEKFNLFDVLKISQAEIRHSNVIAWLLDPKENHGLGDEVLQGFMQYALAAFPNDAGSAPADCSSFTIYRELHNIDVLAVSNKERFLLCVENKIGTGEHDNQLNRYRKRVEEDYPDYRKLYIYLTKNKEEASDPAHWGSMGYEDVLGIVEKARTGVELLPGPALMIDNYVDTLRRDIVGDEELVRVCEEIYFKHQKALDLIFANRPNLSAKITEAVEGWIEDRSVRGDVVRLVDKKSRKTYQFKTKTMSALLPDAENVLSSWETPNFYAYELRNKDGKELYIGLTFALQGMPENLRNACEKICKHYCPSLQPGRKYCYPFESRHFLIEEEFSADNVTGILDKCFEDLRKFEDELQELGV